MARWSITALAIIAAVTFIAASCVLNFMFWAGQGKTHHEGYLLGAVSVAADVLKAVLPISIGWAIATKRWCYAIVATPFFLLFLVAGLVSAVGFVAGNRGDVIGGREAGSAQLAQATADLAALDGQLSRLTGYPPIATLEADIAKLQQHPRYASSDRCASATGPASRELCGAYHDAKGRLGSAIEANRLASKRADIAAEVSRLRNAGAGQEADPQAGIFARWLPGSVGVGTVRDGLAMFFAVLVELGAAFGLYLATHHGGLTLGANRISSKDNRSAHDRGYPVSLENCGQANLPETTHENRITTVITPSPIAELVEPRRFVPRERWINGTDNRLASKGGL